MDSTPRPGEVWVRRDNMNTVSTERQTIHAICVNELFPLVKFMNGAGDIDYSEESKSICQYIIQKCNLSSIVDKREWWENNRKYVKNQITSQRSNKTATLRWAFWGK